MRQRDPDQKLQGIDPGKIQLPDSKEWKTYQVTLVTPMYGGGVEAGKPDSEMPVRATAIRGQLRYWWRFIARNRKENPPSRAELFQKERDIWGGMAELDKDYSSKVKIRIQNIRSYTTSQYSDSIELFKRASYAIFPARAQTGDRQRPAHYLVQAGMKFTLMISSDVTISFDDDVLPALRWWATFGGLGSRTRRGCGSIFMEPFQPITKKEAKALGCRFEQFTSDTPNNAIDAWQKAVQCLQNFRQKPGVGRENGYGRSKWPEPDSIREITGCKSHHVPEHDARISFPRAMFGLPIIFKFKDDDKGEPHQTELTPFDGERMASPLFLTPYPVRKTNGSVHYVPVALLLPHGYCEDINLDLSYSSSNGHKKESLNPVPPESEEKWKVQGWDKWQNEWWDNDKANFVVPIQKNNATNALEAFMNFFAKGGEV